MNEDLSRWRELRRISSCYLIWDEITREAALFDVPQDTSAIVHFIEKEELQLKHVFLTHEHSAERLRAHFPKFLLHTNAKSALPQHRNRSNDFIHLGSLRITNRALLEDRVAYVTGNWPEDAPHVAIVGTIEGLSNEIIREKILNLPSETLVCKSDAPITTVAQLAAGLNSPPG
ncbi:MAG TPA: hypothetical protein VK850_13270 [Candidatus Binatia bacterium]|nr:hypothetical protein [Candidatus Binatia bacterium]